MQKKWARVAALSIAIFLCIASQTRLLQSQDAPKRIEVTARKFSFTPGEITLKKGQPVILVLKSEDVSHGLSFRDFNVNIKAGAGKTAEAQFTPDKTGDFTGHCSVFCGSGHGSMTLKLHVVE
jgi:cytochrome c oxidase subunit 2